MVDALHCCIDSMRGHLNTPIGYFLISLYENKEVLASLSIRLVHLGLDVLQVLLDIVTIDSTGVVSHFNEEIQLFGLQS